MFSFLSFIVFVVCSFLNSGTIYFLLISFLKCLNWCLPCRAVFFCLGNWGVGSSFN